MCSGLDVIGESIGIYDGGDHRFYFDQYRISRVPKNI